MIVGIVAGLLTAAAFNSDVPGWSFLTGMGLMTVLGWIEDFNDGLPVRWRFAVQIVAAVVAILGTGPLHRVPLPLPADIPLGQLGWPVTILWIIGVANIFNFLDGIDGYAGVQGIVAGLGLAAVAGGSWVAPAGIAVAGACLGFLSHNWNPAKIFMGDSGSLTLGFLFAVMPLGEGQVRAPQLVFVAVLCLWFFLSDGMFTILRRLFGGERIWQAHRSHLYQRLTIAGWSHAKVTAWVAFGMVAVAGIGVGADVCGRPLALWCALGIAVLAFLIYWGAVSVVEQRKKGIGSIPSEGNHG